MHPQVRSRVHSNKGAHSLRSSVSPRNNRSALPAARLACSRPLGCSSMRHLHTGDGRPAGCSEGCHRAACMPFAQMVRTQAGVMNVPHRTRQCLHHTVPVRDLSCELLRIILAADRCSRGFEPAVNPGNPRAARELSPIDSNRLEWPIGGRRSSERCSGGSRTRRGRSGRNRNRNRKSDANEPGEAQCKRMSVHRRSPTIHGLYWPRYAGCDVPRRRTREVLQAS